MTIDQIIANLAWPAAFIVAAMLVSWLDRRAAVMSLPVGAVAGTITFLIVFQLSGGVVL